MFAVRLNSRRHFERPFQRTGLLALRVARHHYFSLVSAGILSGALFLALSASSVETGRQSSAQPAAAFTPRPTATPGVAQPRPTPTPPSRLIVYYVVSSEEQQTALEAAVQSDAAHRNRSGISPSPNTTRNFLLVRNALEAAAAAQVLDSFAEAGPAQDYRLRVVDMR